MLTLEPMYLRDKYFDPIEEMIQAIFDEIIYRPLIQIIGLPKRHLTKEVKNSMSALLRAVGEGRIWYEDGQFKGAFNSKTSAAIIRLGGTFNTKSATYSLPERRLPTDIKFAQTKANFQYETMRAQILDALNNMNPQVIDKMHEIRDQYERTLGEMDKDLRKTLPVSAKIKAAFPDNPVSALSRITIEAKLTDGQKKVIAQDWSNNLDIYIKGWVDENVLKLRDEIQPHILAGGRADGLVKVIQDNYGVSTRKAKFLARQETALLMSKFQETRYKDIGINRYRWSTAHDKRVRHDHHKLNGRVFIFDEPPVTNLKTGARNNPGEDFNCRCVAIPLVE